MLPMGQKILDKLASLIDREMKRVGAEKMSLPFLSTKLLWEKSGLHMSRTNFFSCILVSIYIICIYVS